MHNQSMVMQSFSELKLLEGGPVPVGRAGHAACCLNYGSPTPQLLISGGRDDYGTILSDSWILDVVSRRWWEVRHVKYTLKYNYPIAVVLRSMYCTCTCIIIVMLFLLSHDLL